MALRVNLNLALTNIRVWMVSAFKLARRNPMVSRPPEKIRSTATAEPANESAPATIHERAGHTGNTQDVAHKPVKIRELPPSTVPPLKWVHTIEGFRDAGDPKILSKFIGLGR
jgi:hypothetical protein